MSAGFGFKQKKKIRRGTRGIDLRDLIPELGLMDEEMDRGCRICCPIRIHCEMVGQNTVVLILVSI